MVGGDNYFLFLPPPNYIKEYNKHIPYPLPAKLDGSLFVVACTFIDHTCNWFISSVTFIRQVRV